MSYKAEVIADPNGWSSNALRFATYAEAKAWVAALARSWVLVQNTRVVESSDPVNSRFINGELIRV